MNPAIQSIGIVEVSFYASAVVLLDVMLKASNVVLLGSEKLLGGRLVVLFVGGRTSDVLSSLDAARAAAERLMKGHLKVAEAINNPHSEIIRLIVKPENQEVDEHG